jgi:AraC-like DNA-binding protein
MRVSDKEIDRVYISEQGRPADYKMKENHSHNYYEIYYLRHGSCRFFIHNEQYSLHSGDFIVIEPREVHFNKYLTACTRVNVYFRLQDLLEDGRLVIPDLKKHYSPSHVIHIPSGSSSVIDTVIDQMLAEEKINDSSTKIMMPMLLKELFIDFDRYGIFDDPSTSVSNDNEIIKAARYIAEHYNLAITLDSLAREAGLTPTYFSKKFRSTTGMGMKEYLSYTRLKHAAMELLSTRRTITEIALDSGFSNSNYFKDAFKKMYGVSPRNYRNSRKTDYILEQSLLEEEEKKKADQ